MLLACLSSLGLSGCALYPPDVPVCVDIDGARGYCIMTISEKEFEVNDKDLLNNKTWKQIDAISLRVPPWSWAMIKNFILRACKKSGQCSEQELELRINGMEKKGKKCCG